MIEPIFCPTCTESLNEMGLSGTVEHEPPTCDERRKMPIMANLVVIPPPDLDGEPN